MESIEQKIESLLTLPPYSVGTEEKTPVLLDILKAQLDQASQRHAGFANYLRHWPLDYRSAAHVANLPFLPVGVFKANPPLALVERHQIKRTLSSSATTGQIPSRVVLDSPTARRMTKGVIAILRDFLGSARRPYLVVDTPGTAGDKPELGARGAAIQALQPFASEVAYGLRLHAEGELELDRERLTHFSRQHRDATVLVYGFTYILWNHLVKPLMAEGACLGLPNAHVLHSGGWKRLQDQSVDKQTFNQGLARVLGCSTGRVIDFYGLVENVGVIYPDCAEGCKHVPAFGEVVVRHPLTLEPVAQGELGIIQVCSVLPGSFPGHLLLTEDMAQVIGFDGCPCGRRGIHFRFAGRIPKSELRGCGNIQSQR
jgi:hypothetical protein